MNITANLRSYQQVLLWVVSISFLILYLILSYHDRPASDDICNISLLRQEGFWESFLYKYRVWSGRWSVNIGTQILFSLGENVLLHNTYIFLHFIFKMFLFIYGIYYIIKTILSRVLNERLPFYLLFNLSIIFIATFFFATFLVQESWFWIGGSFGYLLSIVMTCVGVAHIINSKLRFFDIIMVVWASLYVGGASEAHAFTMLFVAGCALCYSIARSKNNFFQFAINKKLLIALIGLLASASFSYLAPGNLNRLEDPRTWSTQPDQVDPFATFFYAFLHLKIGLSIFFALLWCLPGIYLKDKLKDVPVGKILIYSLLTLIVLSTVTMIPLVMAFKGLGPARAWTPISFYISLFLCFGSFYLGYRLSKYLEKVILMISLTTIVVLSVYIHKHYQLVSVYAKEYDYNIQAIYSYKATRNNEPLILKRLADPGLLVNGGVSTSYYDWHYPCMKGATGANFDIKIKD